MFHIYFLALLLVDIGLILKLSVLVAILAAILKNKHVPLLGFSVTFSMSFYSILVVKKTLEWFLLQFVVGISLDSLADHVCLVP